MMNFSRRDLLKYFGVSSFAMITNPLFHLANLAVSKAYGQSSTDELNFLYVHLGGGPPRWMYDLPLKPSLTDKLTENDMAKTFYNNETGLFEYKTFEHNGLHVPLMWSGNIPALGGNGDSLQMSSFLDNALMLRSYDTGNESHAGSRSLHATGEPGYPSVAGMIADLSGAPIPSVSYGNPSTYFSEKGIGNVSVSGAKPLNDLLASFSSTSKKSFDDSDIERLIDQSIASLGESFKTSVSKKQSMYDLRLRAKKIFKKDFGDLVAQYKSLNEKYKGLQMQVFSDDKFKIGEGIDQGDFLQLYNLCDQNLVDIKDDPRARYYRLHTGKFSGSNYFADPDLGLDLSQSLSTSTYIPNLSQGLAVAEFVNKQKIASSMSFSIGNIGNVNLNGMRALANDSHFSGCISTMYYFTKYYQALTASLKEYSRSIGNNFENTVVQISGDFNRSGRKDGSGADHGGRGSCTTIYSGKIKSFDIAGNVKTEWTNGSWSGTWGGTGVSPAFGRKIIVADIIATVCEIAGIKKKIDNSRSLVSLRSGKIQNLIGNKNV